MGLGTATCAGRGVVIVRGLSRFAHIRCRGRRLCRNVRETIEGQAQDVEDRIVFGVKAGGVVRPVVCRMDVLAVRFRRNVRFFAIAGGIFRGGHDMPLPVVPEIKTKDI